MAQPIRQLHLSRRGFLRGSGACLALPWLDAMAPALGRAPRAEPGVLFVFSPNGMKMDEWRPDGDGPRAQLPYLLEPLRPVREHLTIVSGLAIDAGFAHGDGPGDHARAASTFLTCAHPVKTGGADIRVGQSIDQAIAERIGEQSTFRSLEFGMEGGRSAGVCDSGYSCAYSNNVSWRTDTTPVAKETDPRRLFERLFGDPEQHADLAAQASRRARLRSVLDLAADDLKGLRKKLGPADQQKLDEYADAVRDVEGRLERIATDEADALESVPGDLLDRRRDAGFAGQLDLAYELLGLALRTGRTRVISFMLGNGGSNRSYRFLGAAEGHHSLSHHRGDPQKLDGIRRINRFHMERLGRFLESLQSMQHADGTLLEHTAVVFGSGISDGNRHNHDDLPVLVAGRAAGRLRPRGHLKVADRTPMANLYLSVAGAVGAEMPTFADSTGRLSEIL